MTAGKRQVAVELIIIPCKRNFDDTKATIGAAIPELDMRPIKESIDAGDLNGALAVLNALPPLLIFDLRPRNVGPFLPHFDHTYKAAQYSIGNPLTAMRMTKLHAGVGLFPPFRVLLRETEVRDKEVVVEYIRPGSLVAHLQNEEVDRIVEQLDSDLEQALLSVAGWTRFGEWQET
ncbi:hypothetical protein CFE70_004921 [Pyrenophora teres f. teres 0-1]|uniref:DUF302 domain-containing protein n=1 Tax=Pyrenophora teres f. teres (strain 0-1) TaxID=861557 RepID=E3RJG0_PYRTT|nr:hypothetical protein PTT_08284 [Pyrenophora teres f. teres 0-1]KAK1913957.1 hypothetical protein P3342_007203 [Pyrenophora teres f. teres]